MTTLPQSNDRIERGLRLVSSVTQINQSNRTVRSEGSPETSYTVTLAGCTCPDSKKGHICKHQFAVFFTASITIHRLRQTPSIEAADSLLESFYLAADEIPAGISMTVRLEHERAAARLDSAHSIAAAWRGPKEISGILIKKACEHTQCNHFKQVNNHHEHYKSRGGTETAPTHKECHVNLHSTRGDFVKFGRSGGQISALDKHWAFTLKNVKSKTFEKLKLRRSRFCYVNRWGLKEPSFVEGIYRIGCGAM
jgi:hypothetical protein